MIEKSDTMKMHDKWTEETLKKKPKHTKDGLPIEPWHILLGLGGILVLVLMIGSLLHH